MTYSGAGSVKAVTFDIFVNAQNGPKLMQVCWNQELDVTDFRDRISSQSTAGMLEI
jgi:hypothetical protein